MTPLLAYTRNVMFLEDGDIGVLTPLGMTVTGAEGQPAHREMVRIDWNAEAAEKGGYPHFMLKEIHEQPQAILDTLARVDTVMTRGKRICRIWRYHRMN